MSNRDFDKRLVHQKKSVNANKKYEGNFLDHIPSGQGTLYDNNGNIIFSGSFEDGAPAIQSV